MINCIVQTLPFVTALDMMCALQAKCQELVKHKNDKLCSQVIANHKLYSPDTVLLHDIALCDGAGRDMGVFQAKYQELLNHKNDKLYSCDTVLLHDVALGDGTGCDACVFQAKYQELVNELLEQHSLSEHKDRLLSAFTELTPPNLPLSITRQNKIAFRGLFDKFMNTVWGFLCVR